MRLSKSILAAALLAIGTAPAAAMDKYRGFGDSITRGSGGTHVFDEASANCNNPEICGYVPRLETDLASLNVDVVNDGFAGGNTVEGVTRIDSVLADGGVAVILMLGTNDLSSLIAGSPGAISINTMKANLGAITDKATALGFDTLISSVIRRIDNTSGDPVALPNEPNTAAFRNMTQQLAAEKGRTWADPWWDLCPDQPCVDDHYYQGGGPNDPGHVDASGYDMMSGIFAPKILTPAVPGAPTPTSPAGDTTASPTFTWSKIGIAHLYQLSVDGPSGNVYEAWHDGTTSCSGSTCTATLPFALGAGSHSWRLRARNLKGTSGWSAALGFVVYTAPPGATSLLEPLGDLWSATPISDPDFRWDALADATKYRLQVKDSASTLVDEIHSAATACSGATCLAEPFASLGAGSYSWRVRPENPAGVAPWSAWAAFVIYDTAPAGATPSSPIGEFFDTDPDFSWAHVPGAEEYLLNVDDGGGSIYSQWHLASGICTAALCMVPAPLTLTPGDYTWDLTSRNPLGDGPASAPAALTVLPCDEPVDLVVPVQEVSTEESWSACMSITIPAGFRVLVSGVASFHAGVEIEVEGGVDVESGGTLILKLDP